MEEQLKAIIQSGSLSNISFYQVNNHFFKLPEKGFWLIDGGIELEFPKGIVSAAFDSEMETLNFNNKPVNEIYLDGNLQKLSNNHISGLRRYYGLKVVNVEFKTIEFDFEMDFTLKTKKEQKCVQMTLEFENKTILQIAFVDYDLIPDQPPKNFTFNLNNDILISTKNVIQINV